MPDGVTIVEAPPPSAPPAPTRTVMASSIPAPVEPTVAKPGSAKDRLFQSLRAKAKDPSTPAVATTPQAPQAGANPSEPPAAPQEGAEAPAASAEGSAAPAPSNAPPKKLTLGQALDNYKKRNRELEAELSEWKTKAGTVDTKALSEKATTLEARNKELEDEIRYINYQKSAEFRDKYTTPYNNAWKRAMSDLKEVRVADAEGNERALTANDMLDIVNMPLARAREVAKSIMGDSYEELMGHRREIKRLLDEQAEALKEARTNGAEREKQRNEQFQKINGEVESYIKTNWDKANDAAHSDPKYGAFFKPIEGDAEGNQRLAKGFELVDRAFAENPKDPRLNAEQRLAIIKRHAAVRNRAAGFGRLAWQAEQKDKRIAELEAKIKEFEGSTPPAGGGNGNQVVIGTSGSVWDSVRGELHKRAK